MGIYGGGNASCDTQGSPFLFDPASYYGDREADLAFTYMFGGFSSAFYDAYEREYPVDSGFLQRKTLTTSITNSIISIYLVVAMQTLPNRA